MASYVGIKCFVLLPSGIRSLDNIGSSKYLALPEVGKREAGDQPGAWRN